MAAAGDSAVVAVVADDPLPLPRAAVPKRVVQTDTTAGSGNALQACVCSLLGLPLIDDIGDDDNASSSDSQPQQQQQQQQQPRVPNFVKRHGGAYEAAIRSFVGGVVTKLPLPLTAAQARARAHSFCILRGQSPRGTHGHVVVARWTGRAFVVECDPHPDDSGLDTSVPYGWAMFLS